MEKINKLGYMAIGMVLAFILGIATPAFAAAAKDAYTTLHALYTWNGKPIELWANHFKVDKDAAGKAVTPFMIGDDVYVPLKTIADALGYAYEDHGDKVFIQHYDFTKPGDKAAPNATLTVTKNDKGEWYDKLDYKFTLDKAAVGEWKMWYVYTDLNDFSPTMPAPEQHFTWTGTSIYADGTYVQRQVAVDESNKRIIETSNPLKWTSGYIMNPEKGLGTDVIPAYSINTVNGKTFMFVEHKSGDYNITGKIFDYYVFVKTSDTPAPAPKTAATTAAPGQDINKITTTKDANGDLHDSIANYKFVLDKDAIGQWDAIDFVPSPDQFDGTDITRKSYVMSSTYNFYDDGTLASYAVKGDGVKKVTWSKGFIIDVDNTIPAYVIKQVNGKTFMFVEWKSGDYTVRGKTPSLEVFIKASDTPAPEFAKK